MIPELVKAVGAMGFVEATEIQSKAIPKLLSLDPDFIGLAQTGTGKTAAFGLPLIQKIDLQNTKTQALIVAPTRELAQQIGKELSSFAKFLKALNISCVYGGTSVGKQIKDLKKDPPHIICGTPGRIMDLANRRAIKLDELSIVVLDEADEMLNMGFQEDIDQILEYTPEEKMTWLFSATMPREIRNIVKKYMTDPVEVSIDRGQVTNQNISHKYLVVKRKDKQEALKRVIDYISDIYCVVFTKTRADAKDLARVLSQEGYNSEALHGDMDQKQRDAAMWRFRSKRTNILIATDVAARGLDVDSLNYVMHYSLPDSIDYYTHRSGRTARAGKKGTSLSFVTPSERRKVRSIASRLKIEMEVVEVPKLSDLIERMIVNWSEELIAIDESDLPEDVAEQAFELFKDVDKEALLKKLMISQLHKVKESSGAEDLNVSSEYREEGRRGGRDRDRGRGRGRDRDRRNGRSRDRDRGGRDRRERDQRRRDERGSGERRSSGGGSGMVPIFVNLGKVDRVNKSGILDFISENGKISRKHVGDIHMHKRHSIFELPRKYAKDIEAQFKGAKYNKRKVKVKIDS